MTIDPKLCMAAGLMMLSVTTAQSGYYFDTEAQTIRMPRWLPYAVLALLAVGSTVVGIIYPDAVGANFD